MSTYSAQHLFNFFQSTFDNIVLTFEALCRILMEFISPKIDWQVPWPMDTVIRIFAVTSSYTAVCREIRRDTSRFCAVFHRNPGNRNTGRLQ